MAVKKFILTLFILFALNFSFQPNQVAFAKEKHTVTYTIDIKLDKYNESFIEKVNKSRFERMVSLAMAVMIVDNAVRGYNSS